MFFSAGLLSDSEFLEFCPPPLSSINRLRSTGTTYARTPQSVVAWDDFEDSVNIWSAIWDSDNTPKYSRPVFTEFQNMCNEATVQEALNFNVFRPLNIVLGEDEVFDRHPSLESVVGEPDFILRSSNQTL